MNEVTKREKKYLEETIEVYTESIYGRISGSTVIKDGYKQLLVRALYEKLLSSYREFFYVTREDYIPERFSFSYTDEEENIYSLDELNDTSVWNKSLSPSSVTTNSFTNRVNNATLTQTITYSKKFSPTITSITSVEKVEYKKVYTLKVNGSNYSIVEGDMTFYRTYGSVTASNGSIKTTLRTESNNRISEAESYADSKLDTGGVTPEQEDIKRYYTEEYDVYKGNPAIITERLYKHIESLKSFQKSLDKINNGEEIPEPTSIEPKEHIDVESQTGHIFPVKLVGDATNKLIDYNNQLVNYINEVERYETKLRKAKEKGVGKINLDFIAKKVEQFCKRINFCLAWLRYYIIKGLRGIFNSIRNVIDPWITTLIDVVEGLMHISLKTIISAVVKFAKAFLEIILFPYKQYIQFGIDVTTYVPPFVNETKNFIDNTQVAVNKGSALYQELQQEVQNIAETAKNTDLLDPEVAQRLAEKYSNISDGNYDFKIEMDSISLSDITSGDEPEKPKWEDYK